MRGKGDGVTSWRSAAGRLAAVVLALLIAGSAAAQQKRLTLDDIYDPAARVNFSGAPPPEIRWIDGSHYALARRTGSGVDWIKVDAATGAESPLFDAVAIQAALARAAGVAPDQAAAALHSRDLVFNATYTALVARVADDLFYCPTAGGRIVRLTNAAGTEEHPSFSPDGRYVAFVRGNNLHVSDTAAGQDTALTRDGSAVVLNGRLDWVYEEEIYGRGKNRAYWWSPDSTALAFLRIDDGPVPVYPVLDHLPYDPAVEEWRYPKAGDRNPLVTLGVASPSGGPVRWVDLGRHDPADRLVVRVTWTPDSRRIVYAIQNRTQTWLELNAADARTGASRTLLRETSPHWISSEDVVPPIWLPDGSFLWSSDRSGWRHIYRYRADGTLAAQVTSGRWEVRIVHGVDASGWIYFSGTERSPIGEDIYRIKTDGTGLQRLSADEGTHAADFSPSFAFYTDVWSTATMPPRVDLRASDGALVRVVQANEVPALREYRLARPEFLQVPARDGFLMEAMMLKPPDFDPSRRYPVYQFTYGGPHAPQVRNAWGGSQYMFHQLLAQHGIIVWICDNRTASGKGSESAWQLAGRFGESELRDIEDGLAWLERQPYVDPTRIGLHGWSYGGYLTSYALTHSTRFAMGIAGGTVADWRDYDSVYTERYLGLPKDHPDAYRDSSPRFSAASLHGALLLVHGTMDDNVHVASTLQFAYELQQAGKPFQLMLYPRSRHGVTDPRLVKHLRSTMLAFILDHLRPDARAGAS